jgi:hypothetical protein
LGARVEDRCGVVYTSLPPASPLWVSAVTDWVLKTISMALRRHGRPGAKSRRCGHITEGKLQWLERWATGASVPVAREEGFWARI